MQRTAILTLLLSAAPLAVNADPLSEADREALIEKLDNLKDTAKEKAMGRIGIAMSAPITPITVAPTSADSSTAIEEMSTVLRMTRGTRM